MSDETAVVLDGVAALGTVQQVNPKKVWPSEERDFTPWLADHIELLSEALGLELEVQQTERKVGAYELDIEAQIVGTTSKVVIENQLGATDHGHMGQLLAYAAGLGANVAVWVSPNPRDEHVSVIEWLNRVTVPDVAYFLVKLEVIRIGDSQPAPVFSVVAGPSSFQRSIRSDDEDAPRHAFRRDFWKRLYAYLADRGMREAKGREPTKESWVTFGVGLTGVALNVSMTSSSRIRVEIYFSHADRAVNKRRFDVAIASREAFESQLPGEQVSWERLDDKTASRIALYRDYDKESVLKESSAQTTLFDWILKSLKLMRQLSKQFIVQPERA